MKRPAQVYEVYDNFNAGFVNLARTMWSGCGACRSHGGKETAATHQGIGTELSGTLRESAEERGREREKKTDKER